MKKRRPPNAPRPPGAEHGRPKRVGVDANGWEWAEYERYIVHRSPPSWGLNRIEIQERKAGPKKSRGRKPSSLRAQVSLTVQDIAAVLNEANRLKARLEAARAEAAEAFVSARRKFRRASRAADKAILNEELRLTRERLRRTWRERVTLTAAAELASKDKAEQERMIRHAAHLILPQPLGFARENRKRN